MPVDAAVTPTSHHGLCDDPATLHRRHIDDIESLTEWNTVCTISIQKHPIASIHFDSILFEEQTHGNLGSIMPGHEHLLAVEFIPDDLGSVQRD